MNASLKRNLSLTVGAALAAQSLGCGTLMYPDRRGYHSGRIDVGVAVLDGLGLLLFIIPGVIAYAVDFSDGAIYLPGGARGELGMRKVYFPRTGNDAAEIERVVRAQTGRDVDPNAADVQVIRLNSTAELPARFARARMLTAQNDR
jgi:hypothetical protein